MICPILLDGYQFRKTPVVNIILLQISAIEPPSFPTTKPTYTKRPSFSSSCSALLAGRYQLDPQPCTNSKMFRLMVNHNTVTILFYCSLWNRNRHGYTEEELEEIAFPEQRTFNRLCFKLGAHTGKVVES